VITFSHTGHTWQLRHTVTDVNGNKLTDAFANYDDASFHPLTSNYANINGTTTLREAVDFVTSPGNASASLGFDGQASDQYSVPLAVAVATDFDEFWIYRWAHGTISAALSGKFGRIGIVSPTAAQNWARETPVTVSIKTRLWRRLQRMVLDCCKWLSPRAAQHPRSCVSSALVRMKTVRGAA
jgi:hypothetical protein